MVEVVFVLVGYVKCMYNIVVKNKDVDDVVVVWLIEDVVEGC